MIDVPNKCAKQTVIAFILPVNSETVPYGWNHCATPQAECPRGDMPSGEGYELCVNVCGQTGHAEVEAIKMAESKEIDIVDSLMIIYGHTYSCEDCKKAMKEAGVSGYFIDGEFHALV